MKLPPPNSYQNYILFPVTIDKKGYYQAYYRNGNLVISYPSRIKDMQKDWNNYNEIQIDWEKF
jgi:hypothetical protein